MAAICSAVSAAICGPATPTRRFRSTQKQLPPRDEREGVEARARFSHVEVERESWTKATRVGCVGERGSVRERETTHLRGGESQQLRDGQRGDGGGGQRPQLVRGEKRQLVALDRRHLCDSPSRFKRKTHTPPR
jgi:hypothetical protein